MRKEENPKMPDSGHGMIEQHPWSGIAHHDPDLGAPRRSITMYEATFTGGFRTTEPTCVELPVRIGQQVCATGAQRPIALFAAAVEFDHLPERVFFAVYAVHWGYGSVGKATNNLPESSATIPSPDGHLRVVFHNFDDLSDPRLHIILDGRYAPDTESLDVLRPARAGFRRWIINRI